MEKQLISILVILLVIFLSCEEDTDVKLPDFDSKLSVYGFLSPEDTITNIYVRKTKSYFGEKVQIEDSAITNAYVKITNTIDEYILPYSAETNSYYLDSNNLKIIPGEEYFLEVSVPDFPIATSSLTIPANKNQTLEYIDVQQPRGDDYVYFNLKWTDNDDEKNYYRLSGYYNYEDLIYDYIDALYLLDENALFIYDDEDWNGLVKISNDLGYYSYIFSETIAVHFILLNVDFHYYKYHQSAFDQNTFSKNPFAEPILVYSNIENGTGVFASYRKYEIVENVTLLK